MRGPLLSGPLGRAPALAALTRWTAERSPVVVLGPPWLGNAVASGGRTLVVVEAATRPTALRAQRRARREQRPLDVAIAAGELPFRRGSLSAIVVENVAGLPAADATRWLEALVLCLRPGGRLIAADATASTDAAARVSGCFLSVSLTNIVQEWPCEGALLTIGASPPPAVVMARLGL